MKSKKPLVWTLVAILVVSLGIYGVWGWNLKQKIAQFENAKQPPVTVSATEARTQSWQPQIPAVGTLRAAQGVSVASEVSGKVEKILFESGATVKQGELLVQLDDSTEQAELPGARARVKLARNTYQRNLKLRDQGLISEEQLEASFSELEQAESALQSLQATIAKRAIRAPFGGTLGIRMVDVGQFIGAGTQIVNLQALDKLYVDFTLPEQYLGRIEVGQPVEVITSVNRDATVTGKVSAVDVQLDPATRNFGVRATIDNAEANLRPGMFADVQVMVGEKREVTVVPKVAISFSLYGDSVYVVSEKQNEQGETTLMATQTFVETGESRNGYVEIVSGIEPSARVVTAGQLKLQRESPVTIDNEVALN